MYSGQRSELGFSFLCPGPDGFPQRPMCLGKVRVPDDGDLCILVDQVKELKRRSAVSGSQNRIFDGPRVVWHCVV